jgi:aminoglycoside phosphotransferase (APT) family kinase protein
MMPSVDKAAITPALVSRLVAAQFPQWAGRPVRPVELDGWDNATFRLGEDMSVRLPSGRQYALQVDKEHRWLPVLARHLPLAIPQPLAKGAPGLGYPWPWSVYRWLDGRPVAAGQLASMSQFAGDLAGFLAALYRVDPAGGPQPGAHNFFRGGPPATYDDETRDAIAVLRDDIDARGATEVWEAALAATWSGAPVWVHGDVSVGNLLARRGRLSAVIDFGSSAVGDPACDVTIAWTFLSGESREAFRAALPVDAATWARGRGWALWKALIMLAAGQRGHPEEAGTRRIIQDVIAEHQEAA